MLFRTHAFLAIGSLWLLAPIPGAVTAETIGPLAIAAVVGAMLPDLDAPRSTISRLPIRGIRPFELASAVIHRAWGHRGPLHSVVGLAAMALPAGLLAPLWGWPVSAALWLGYASHLAADACTISGVPLLPNGKGRLHLLPKRLRFTTGSDVEDILLPILLGLALLLVLSRAHLGG